MDTTFLLENKALVNEILTKLWSISTSFNRAILVIWLYSININRINSKYLLTTYIKIL